jgi:hypothetical protein
MEAPFRFKIDALSDLERLLTAIVASPDLVPGSLALTEGMELLAEQFAAEGRHQPPGSALALFRELWECPLREQRPRFLRLEAQVLVPPPAALSLRVDVPTRDAFPRWIDAEGSRDAAALAHLLDIYRRLSQASRLPFIAV